MKLRLASTALDGRTVTLTLAQDGVQVGPLTADAWGGPPPPSGAQSVTVEVRRTRSETAPELVFFDVTGWDGFDTEAGDIPGYDARRHELVHIWSFGDPGQWLAPENVLPEWRDANTARGPFVSHTFRGPGDYAWSLMVIEPMTGKVATTSGAVTVYDPDVTFGGTGTAYWAPDGDFSQAPAGAQQVTTYAQAVAAKGARPGGFRVLMARGKTFFWASNDTATSGASKVRLDNEKGPIHFIAAPGTGARPHVEPADYDNEAIFDTWYDYQGGELVFQGIDFKGEWDADTETGRVANGLILRHVGTALIDDCTFDGFVSAYSQYYNNRDQTTNSTPADLAEREAVNLANVTATAIGMNDSYITNWKNFGMYGAAIGWFSLTGMRITSGPNARNGSSLRTGDYTNHGCWRISQDHPGRGYVAGCDHFNRHGWFPNINLVTTTQPNCRWNSEFTEGCFLNVDRSSFEGGFNVFANRHKDDQAAVHVSPVLLDKAIFVAHHMTATLLDMQGGGHTIRNVLGIYPNNDRIYMPQSYRALATINGGRNGAQLPVGSPSITAPVTIAGVTLIDLLDTVATDGKPMLFSQAISGCTPEQITEIDCILHQPNLDTPVVPFGPLDDTPLWEARDTGVKSSVDTYDTTYPAAFGPGDVVTFPWPPGKSQADYWQGADPQTDIRIGRDGFPGIEVEHIAAGIRCTNTGTSAYAQGDAAQLILDRRDNPLVMPETAPPPGSVWSGRPLAGSAAIGAAATDEVPYEDLRMRVRPIHASVGALEP